MTERTYKEIIKETITFLGGRAAIFEIYDFIENNYSSFLKGKNKKTWKNTVRYNLSVGPFYQMKDSELNTNSFTKHWYNNGPSDKLDPEIILEEKIQQIMQKEFEEALRFIQSNKEYQETMLDYYLEF